MCNSRCTETRCLALFSKHRDRHRKSLVGKHRDKNIVFKKPWNIARLKTQWRWDICWLRLMKRKDAHFDAEILHISKEAGSNIVAASVKVGFTSIFLIKLRWIDPFDQKTHLDKTPTFKILQKPTLTKHPPLKYCKNPPWQNTHL